MGNKVYTAVFKNMVADVYQQGNETLAELSKRFDVHPKNISNWRMQRYGKSRKRGTPIFTFKKDTVSRIPQSGVAKQLSLPTESDLQMAMKRNEELRKEIDFFKGTVEIFLKLKKQR